MKNTIKINFLTWLLTYVSVIAFGQQKGLLWEISGNGLAQKSYLYGTMHVTDERVFNFPNSFKTAFDACQAFAMELNLDSAQNPANAFSLMQMMMMTDGKTLKDLVSKKDYKIAEKFFKDNSPTPLSMVSMMKPIFLMSFVEMAKPKPAGQREEPLDKYLATLAKNAEKPIIGLETVQEQMQALNIIPVQEQAKQLINAIKETQKMKKNNNSKMDELMKYYTQGDLTKLYELSQKSDLKGDAQKALITQRNHNMTDRIDAKIKNTSIFIAIGALHLPGEEGVIRLLEKKGYTLKSMP